MAALLNSCETLVTPARSTPCTLASGTTRAPDMNPEGWPRTARHTARMK
jgi:hypothetical protein